jgi:hypothetical protein
MSSRFQDPKPVPARGTQTPVAGSQWTRRRWVQTAALSLAGAAVLGGATLNSLRTREEGSPRTPRELLPGVPRYRTPNVLAADLRKISGAFERIYNVDHNSLRRGWRNRLLTFRADTTQMMSDIGAMWREIPNIQAQPGNPGYLSVENHFHAVQDGARISQAAFVGGPATASLAHRIYALLQYFELCSNYTYYTLKRPQRIGEVPDWSIRQFNLTFSDTKKKDFADAAAALPLLKQLQIEAQNEAKLAAR